MFYQRKTTILTGLYFYDYLSITVIPMSVSVMYLLKTLNKPLFNKKVTKKLTLGIYLIHPAILEPLNALHLGAINFEPSISIPVITFIIFTASAGITWVLSRTPYLRRTI